MTNLDIIAAARSLLGTPFVHQGRIPGVALDCAGFVISVAAALGIEYVDRKGYGVRPVDGLLEEALNDQPGIERVPDAEPGDIVLMRFFGDPTHLAIYTGSTLIHANQSVGKVCEHSVTPVWKRKFVHAYRFKGVAR